MIVFLTELPPRDDLTVEVIFFGEGEGGGDVVMNHEASNPSLGTRSKL